MPICITCTTPIPHLYTTYSKADDRTLGKGVRLTQCPNCKRFADKYVEHDYIVLFIDLVLIKPQVYRHLLFNRLGASDHASASSNSKTPQRSRMDPSILRLGILLVLFDVYITWARIERANAHPQAHSSGIFGDSGKAQANRLTTAPILVQYLFFLTLNVASTLAQHLTIRSLASWMLQWRERRAERASHNEHSSPRPAPAQTDRNPDSFRASPAAVSTAILVSSCTKLFPILLVIWPPATGDGSESGTAGPFASRASSYISWVVLFNNIEALLILLNCGYVATTGLAVSGMLARYVVEGWLLSMAGLSRDASGPVSDLVEVIGWFRKTWGYG